MGHRFAGLMNVIMGQSITLGKAATPGRSLNGEARKNNSAL
jgi:hypothetical protein